MAAPQCTSISAYAAYLADLNTLMPSADQLTRMLQSLRSPNTKTRIQLPLHCKPMLATTSICGMDVRARPPADKTRSSGFVYGVDPEIDIPTILEAMESPVPVESARRTDARTVQLRFVASAPPACVWLFKLRLAVRACRPRPLQCGHCGHFDHATPSCRTGQRCSRCGGDHNKGQCEVRRPRCTNCGGPHAVDNARCPRWQRERHLETLLARSSQPMARSEARAVVQAAERPVPAPRKCNQRRRSYAQAAGGRASSSAAVPPATTTVPGAPAAPRREPEQCEKVIAALVAAVQALVEGLPADSPARIIAAAALELAKQ